MREKCKRKNWPFAILLRNDIIQKDIERERGAFGYRNWKGKQREKEFNIKWQTCCEMTLLPFISGLGTKFLSKFSWQWIMGVRENFELGREIGNIRF